MTCRKSGLSFDDSSTDGLTSVCNTSESAVDLRDRALKIEKAIELAQHYETVSLTDLAAWPAKFTYETLPSSLKQYVKGYYIWQQLRSAGADYHTTQAGNNQRYDRLDDTVHDRLATELCDIHIILLYTLHTQVLPEYIAYHTQGGEQTVHWESIPVESDCSRLAAVCQVLSILGCTKVTMHTYYLCIRFAARCIL
jgi:hypothetical protein